MLFGTSLAANLPFASAGSEVCPCVVLIEVDGLEPQDITKETTPFLWDLAHPTIVTDANRAGWTWQAPRSVMSASTAANAASLLTGGYVEQTGIPGDEFIADGGKERLELTPQDGAGVIDDGDFEAESLLNLIPLGSEGKKDVAAFVGNPTLGPIAAAGETKTSLVWWPENGPSDAPPSPAYCDVPRRLPGGETENETKFDQESVACHAPDQVTMHKAITALNTQDASNVAFTYIHLAELGVAKRRNGDLSAGVDQPSAETEAGGAQVTVPEALATLDAAVEVFVQRYKQESSTQTKDKWDKTFLMVTGNHGYETVPQTQRVPPAPGGNTTETFDLEEWVEADGDFEYIPQGSMATIYANGTGLRTLEQKRASLDRLRNSMLNSNDAGVEGVAQCAQSATPPIEDGTTEAGGCIEGVFYTREELLPPDYNDPETKNEDSIVAERRKMLLPAAHPTWHYDHINSEEPKGPSGVSGDLVVIMEDGWAAGRVAPTPTLTPSDDTGAIPVRDQENPYIGSAGGPRNRAVAAIVNGPQGGEGVRQVQAEGGRYPVTTGPDTVVPIDETPQARYDSLTEANRNPGDDANDEGHERQPETIDFAPTIAALMQISVPDSQMPDESRFLQEAFIKPLSFPSDEEVLEEPEPDPPPPPDEPDTVIVLPPPPIVQPPPACAGYGYRGLMKNFRAAVGGSVTRTRYEMVGSGKKKKRKKVSFKEGVLYPDAPAKTRLSSLILTADFGKPRSLVTLTFYSDKVTKSSRKGRKSARRVVKTLATFDPFTIERGPAKLTLKVPDVFKPTHVGIVVQRARRATRAELEQAQEALDAENKRKGTEKKLSKPYYVGTGAKVGGIYPVKYAKYLHTKAPKRKQKRSKKKKAEPRCPYGEVVAQ